MLYIWIQRNIKNDRCYHTKDCKIVKKARKENPSTYKHTSVETARAKGYTPCTVCKPNDIEHKVKILKKIVEDSKKLPKTQR